MSELFELKSKILTESNLVFFDEFLAGIALDRYENLQFKIEVLKVFIDADNLDKLFDAFLNSNFFCSSEVAIYTLNNYNFSKASSRLMDFLKFLLRVKYGFLIINDSLSDFEVIFIDAFKHWGDQEAVFENVIVNGGDWSFTHDGDEVFYRPKTHHMQRGISTISLDGLKIDIFLKKKPIVSLDSAVLIGGLDNYYHNLIDYYLNFFSVSSSQEVVIFKEKSKYHAQMRTYFGLKNVTELDFNQSCSVRSLTLPRKAVVNSGEVTYIDPILNLRKFIEPRVKLNSNNRLFISRSKAGYRRASNEYEAFLAVERFGFKLIHLEDLQFEEQVSLFYGAEVVVGLHGAGFSNIIFCRDKISVVEIMPNQTYQLKYFSNLCSGLDFNYLQTDAQGGFYASDIFIDVEAFVTAVSSVFP